MDRVLFQMPRTDAREFLAALSVVQDHSLQMIHAAMKGARDKDIEFHFRVEEKFRYFEPCLKMVQEYTPVVDYSGWYGMSRREFDCYVNFDFEVGYELAKPNRKHITDALGIMIGASPRKWPVLRALQLPKPQAPKVLILDWDAPKDHAEQFVEMLSINHPEVWVQLAEIDNPDDDFESILKDINEYSIVIGKAGLATYMAASLFRGLIEIFPEDKEFVMYNNQGLSHYKAILSKEVKPELMFAVWRELWETYETTSGTAWADQLIPMEQSPSIAADVVEKLSVSLE